MSDASGKLSSPRSFAPGWLLTLFVLAFLPLLLALGVWQLDRAEQKREMQAAMDESRTAVPASLGQLATDAEPAWRPLYLQGTFDKDVIWLLDNRTRGGRAGVEVLQPFQDADSAQWIIVNRGWISWADRSSLPDIETPQGQVQLDAEALPIAGTGFTLGDTSARSGWPKLITAVEPALMAEQAGIDALPWTARLRQGSAGAFRLEWPPLPTTASKHTGYAVQWFALAAALLILYIWAGYRPDSDREQNIEQPGS